MSAKDYDNLREVMRMIHAACKPKPAIDLERVKAAVARVLLKR